MNDSQKRVLAFLLGCIPTRMLLSYLAYRCPDEYLPYLGYLALLPAIGFTIIYTLGLRRTGAEVFGKSIWWDRLRPVHALLYFSFAYMAIKRLPRAWMLLLIDALLGLFSFLLFHFVIAHDLSL